MTPLATAAEVARFRRLLADLLGWTLADEDPARLADVLSRHADRRRSSRADYLARLEAGGPVELAELAEELTITETYFFRHSEQFRSLADDALPDRMRARAAERALRMLSVGCASGEEAYTLAIVARQAQPDPDWRIDVTGVDVNRAMLRRATVGRYSGWALRETPEAVRRRWFRPHDRGYEVDPRLRAAVQFRWHNVVADDPVLWSAQHYDVIFCRNLLMYLDAPVAAALVARMTRALAPGGYLFLGHTDTLGTNPPGLEVQRTHGTFYYRRPGPTGTELPGTEPIGTGLTGTRPARPPGDDRTPSSGAAPNSRRADPRQRALALLSAERFTEALAELQSEMPERPTRAEDLLHGVLLAQAGHLDDARLVADRLLDAGGPYADAHQLLALCLEAGGDDDAAMLQYRLAALVDPGFAMPRLRLGVLSRRHGDHRGAAAALHAALGLLRHEADERIALFGGGFGRISLIGVCRAELDACGAHR